MNASKEFYTNKSVHRSFDAGSSYSLVTKRAETLRNKRRDTSISSNPQLQLDVEQLNKNGYVVLKDLITDPQKLKEIYLESKHLLKHTKVGRNIFEGRLTKRCHNLTSKSGMYDDFVLHKRCLNILDYYLYPNHLLSILQLIQIEAHSSPQPLHYDSQSLYGLDRPRLDTPMQLAFFWALDDNYTPDQGATILYPGSHLWPPNRGPTENDTKITFHLSAGSAICILGTLWHGGGEHLGKTNEPRLILTSQHVQPYIRQIENLMLATPLDMIDKMPPRLQAMIGYSIHFPFYGSVDGVHPKKAIPQLLKRYSKL